MHRGGVVNEVPRVVPPWAGTALLLVVALAVAATFLLVLPIPQDPNYHRFADTRALLGIPHFWNVASNLPFILVGFAGLILQARAAKRGARPEPSEWLFCAAILLVGPGSAWYHLDPTTESLFWDRLPMTVGFMALTAALFGDALGARWGRWSLVPLVAVGVGAVVYWRLTEQGGAGDLRAYGLVQFLPLVLIPLLGAVCGFRRYRFRYLGLALLFYLLAKGAEVGDLAMFDAAGGVGGHAVKHLLAAVACGFVVRLFLVQKA
jgi:hypothetical protein